MVWFDLKQAADIRKPSKETKLKQLCHVVKHTFLVNANAWWVFFLKDEVVIWKQHFAFAHAIISDIKFGLFLNISMQLI